MTTLAELKNEETLSVDEFMCLLFGLEPGTMKFDDRDSKDLPEGATLAYDMLMKDIEAKKLHVSVEDGKLLKSELEKWKAEHHSKIEKRQAQFDRMSEYLQAKRRERLGFLNSTNPLNDCSYYISEKWLTDKPPEPEFCVNPLVPIGAVTLLNAHGGTGKSIFALKMAIHIALGLPIIGAETNGGKVAYMSLEDSANIVRNRIFKIFKALPEESEEQHRIGELTKKIMIIDRYGLPTYMAEKQSGNIITPSIAGALSSLLKGQKITCLFVDTFIRTNPLNENDNAEMGRLLVTYEGIAKEAECGVVLIHHLPKPRIGASRSYAARGASAITDNARSVLLLQIVPKTDAKIFAKENDRDNDKDTVLKGQLIEVTHIKHNYSDEYPTQYLRMTNNGILLETSSTSLSTTPTTSPKSGSSYDIRQLYNQLYDWWINDLGGKPVTKNQINDKSVKIIRKPNAGPGKDRYKEALDWAYENGYAEKATPPKGGKQDVGYYTLKSLNGQQSLDKIPDERLDKILDKILDEIPDEIPDEVFDEIVDEILDDEEIMALEELDMLSQIPPDDEEIMALEEEIIADEMPEEEEEFFADTGELVVLDEKD